MIDPKLRSTLGHHSSRQGLSLKYKILLALILLPLLMLAAFLLLALKIVREDKVAYVFESSSAVARSLAAQTTTELAGALLSAKPVMQEFISSQKFGVVAEGFFATEGPTEWILAYRRSAKNPSQYEGVGSQEREPGQALREIQMIPDFSRFLGLVLRQGRGVIAPFGDDRVLLAEKVGEPGTVGETLFVILTRVPNLLEEFRTPGAVQSYLVAEQGGVLFGASGESGGDFSSRVDTGYLSRVFAARFTSGAETLRAPGGKEWLTAFARTDFGSLAVVSMIPQSEALKALGVLIQSSAIFLVILLSITVILGLFASARLTWALTDLSQATRRVAEGNFDVQVQVTSRDEIGSLAGSFNAMAAEVSRLMMETAQKARMESELKTAQTVQETLFPPPRAELGGLRIAGHYEPASECGGDWWHYCLVDGKVYVWIGDATGHGAPAALITSAAKSAATIIEQLKVTPSEALTYLNRAISEVSKGRIMMTFFLGCYDPLTRVFVYANASHEAPFLIRKTDKPPKKKDLEPLNEVTDPRLGQAVDTVYRETSIQLAPGDRILLYTDGIPDVRSPGGEAWGEREFIKAIVATQESYPSVDVAVDDMVQRFSEFRQGSTLVDDVTFFEMEVLST